MSAPPPSAVAIVVPCFDEAARLDGSALCGLVDSDPALSLVLVDDGSRDATPELHARLVATRPRRIQALRLPQNRGKAEAVRQGLLAALAGPADLVGYADADLATPPSEILRLCALMRGLPSCDVLLAARVKLMGRTIDRRATRHYLGRVFATAASLLLDLPVYDTQCGAKVLRRTAALGAALEHPFLSRWVFDVELLGRLLAGAPGVPALTPERILEEPLLCWRDTAGSKVRARHMVAAVADIARIGIDLHARRRV